jgi:site-specific recombinase XerC
MDSAEQQPPSIFPLDRLVAIALRELEKLRYSQRSLRRYRTVWGHFVTFARERHPEAAYSEQLATQFIDAYRLPSDAPAQGHEEWRRHIAFLVKVLGDFARDGRVERTVTDMQRIQVPAGMKKPLCDYEQYCRDRRHLRAATLRERMRTIAVFLNDLGARNVTAPDQMQPADIAAFAATRRRLGARSMSRTVSDVRCFLQFLLLRGMVPRDFSQVLPTVRVPRDATIPSVWDPDLLMRLLNVVDRSSPRGKRDYAILLLACRLGLRLGDIQALRLDDLKWDTAAIEFAQSKTGAPLCLPMTEEVGEALIDYLQFGRPQTAYRELFLRAQPPFTPLADDGRFYDIVKYWRELAGIRFRSKQHCGLHSLRHTLATQLVREQTPIHVISQILGHATTASTMIYAKADVEALRGAALNPEEVRHEE